MRVLLPPHMVAVLHHEGNNHFPVSTNCNGLDCCHTDIPCSNCHCPCSSRFHRCNCRRFRTNENKPEKYNNNKNTRIENHSYPMLDKFRCSSLFWRLAVPRIFLCRNRLMMKNSSDNDNVAVTPLATSHMLKSMFLSDVAANVSSRQMNSQHELPT